MSVHSSAFFNNKGGVGKTTSIANLGDRLGAMGYKVVVVDLDPQCNMTQYFLSDDDWEDLYLDSGKSASETVWNFVRPVSQSRSIQDVDSSPVSLREGRFNFKLVPGHPFVSRLDDALAESWGKLRLAQVGGIESTFWCESLLATLERQVVGLDYVLFDLGPSLGPLNRSVLLASDSFVSPVSPDLFSLYSFDNLRTWFKSLKDALRGARTFLDDDTEDNSSARWYEQVTAGVRVASLGYISQEYVTRSTRGERRQTRAYARFFAEMPEKANALIGELDQGSGRAPFSSPQIGVMPHMYSMVSLAHDAHAPIADLTSADGLTGAQFRQRDRYVEDMEVICDEWVHRMGVV